MVELVGLFDFEARESDEVSFKEGDILKFLDDSEDPLWYKVQLNDQQGFVPRNYVELRLSNNNSYLCSNANQIEIPKRTTANHSEAPSSSINGNSGDKFTQAAKVFSARTTAKSKNNISFRCDVCNVSCTAQELLHLHNKGKKHLRNLSLLLNKNSNISATLSGASRPSTSSFSPLILLNSPNYCHICKVPCSGTEQYQMHINGKQHKKKAVGSSISFSSASNLSSDFPTVSSCNANSCLNFATNISTMSTSANDTASDVVSSTEAIAIPVQKNPKLFVCFVCNVECSGTENFLQHVDGKKHKKAMEGVSPPHSANCKICNVLCTNLEQLLVHQKGAKHLEKAKKLRVSLLLKLKRSQDPVEKTELQNELYALFGSKTETKASDASITLVRAPSNKRTAFTETTRKPELNKRPMDWDDPWNPDGPVSLDPKKAKKK